MRRPTKSEKEFALELLSSILTLSGLVAVALLIVNFPQVAPAASAVLAALMVAMVVGWFAWALLVPVAKEKQP